MKENQEKLTSAELRRKEQYERKREKLKQDGYEEHKILIGGLYANLMSLVYGIPLILFFGAVYFLVNRGIDFEVGDNLIMYYFIYLGSLIVLTVVHELIHGLFFGIWCKNHFKSIEFGFKLKQMVAYCTCAEPLTKGQYIVALLMPTIVLGFIPCIVAIMTESLLLFLIGATMILGGGGDFTIFFKIIRYRSELKDRVWIDHPYECGIVVFEK